MTRHEAAIREDLRIAFARMDELDDADIRLHVRDGVVTLYGDVDDHHAVSCAVRAAHDVAGVIHVRSALVVRPDVADERKPIAEFRTSEDAWFMTSPGYRFVDGI